MTHSYDVIIIGGGILGFSTAMQLQQAFPSYRIAVVEKEAGPARHQSGHNSGVIHAGVYYQPGSLKARFCREGLSQIVDFCQQHSISYQSPGKLIVATNEVELQRMYALADRARKNGLSVELLNKKQLSQRQPHISGEGAFYVSDSKIIDWKTVTNKYAELFQQAGGQVFYNQQVQRINEQTNQVKIITKGGEQFISQHCITCGGLMADRLVQCSGLKADFSIIPFRGEYYQLPEQYSEAIHHLIYPVPDPALPFLGVHLTKMIDGSVTVGPNAVLALGRESYRRSDINIKDSWSIATNASFWKLLKRHFKPVLQEMKTSLSKQAYLDQVKKYCPGLTLTDLKPYPAGVRAQALDADGQLIQDFLFKKTQRVLHVCNAPSPAATSSLPIGAHIVQQYRQMSDHVS